MRCYIGRIGLGRSLPDLSRDRRQDQPPGLQRWGRGAHGARLPAEGGQCRRVRKVTGRHHSRPARRVLQNQCRLGVEPHHLLPRTA